MAFTVNVKPPHVCYPRPHSADLSDQTATFCPDKRGSCLLHIREALSAAVWSSGDSQWGTLNAASLSLFLVITAHTLVRIHSLIQPLQMFPCPADLMLSLIHLQQPSFFFQNDLFKSFSPTRSRNSACRSCREVLGWNYIKSLTDLEPEVTNQLVCFIVFFWVIKSKWSWEVLELLHSSSSDK